MANTTQQDNTELTTAITNLLAALGNGNGATPTAVAEATKAVKKAAPVEEVAPQDALVEEKGLRYGKGSTVLSAEGIKAAARVLKSGKPEAIAKDEGNGSHVILFRTDKGNVRVQNAFTPKA